MELIYFISWDTSVTAINSASIGETAIHIRFITLHKMEILFIKIEIRTKNGDGSDAQLASTYVITCSWGLLNGMKRSRDLDEFGYFNTLN